MSSIFVLKEAVSLVIVRCFKRLLTAVSATNGEAQNTNTAYFGTVITSLTIEIGRAMAQAVSLRACRFASGQSMRELWWTKWHWDSFFADFFGFPCQYHSTVSLHIHIYHLRFER
jgi:hypothetical protein